MKKPIKLITGEIEGPESFLFIFLLAVLFYVLGSLLSCVPEEEPERIGCVIYDGYNQIWVKDLTERPDGALDVVGRNGVKWRVKSYSAYECF